MKMDISFAQKRGFTVSERGEFLLVTPPKDKHLWKADEIWYRSLLLTREGEVVSSGFPKFFNYGENPDHDILTTELFEGSETLFTEKMDGMLMIRFVVDGKVCFRTRGNHVVESDVYTRLMSLVETFYPKLLDSLLFPEGSLLFEFMTPEDQIVIRYSEPKLTLLGYVHHPRDGSGQPQVVCSRHVLQLVHQQLGVPPVKTYSLAGNLKAISHEVSTWENQEGIVTWSLLPSGSTHLTKFKSVWYCRLHALLSHLTEDRVWKICWANQIKDVSVLKQYFENLGLDWESLGVVSDAFASYQQRKFLVEYVFAQLKGALEIAVDTSPEILSRKDKALLAKNMTSKEPFTTYFQEAIYFLTGEDLKVRKALEAKILGVSGSQLDTLNKQDFSLTALTVSQRVSP